MKTKIIAIAGGVILLAIALYTFGTSKGGSFGAITTGSTTTVSSSTLTSTASLIMSANPSAQYRSFTNRTGITAWLMCRSSTTTANFTAGTGDYLAPSATIRMVEEDGTMWCTDNVYGITGGGTAIISTQER